MFLDDSASFWLTSMTSVGGAASPAYPLYIPISNRLNVPNDLIFTKDLRTTKLNATKHTAGAADFTDVQVGYFNARFSQSTRFPAHYDMIVSGYVLYNGTLYQMTFGGNTTVTILRNFGTAKSDIIPGLTIPAGATFYVYTKTVALDYASANNAVGSYTTANPVVVTATGHGYANGDTVRFRDVATTVTGSITGATNASLCVITSVAHGLSVGNLVRIGGNGDGTVGGMTQLNGNTYRVGTVPTADTFSLRTVPDAGNTSGSAINSTAFGTYTSGGTWRKLAPINYGGNGLVDYTVANATANTFELSGVNGTTFDSPESPGVGFADRVYIHYGTTTGSGLTVDGAISSDDETLDITTVARGALALPINPANVGANGNITAISVDPANNGVNYAAGGQIEPWYGRAGSNALGAIYPGRAPTGAFTSTSSGHVSSINVGTGGVRHDPSNLPPIYLKGVGNVASGWGATNGCYGPLVVFGTPSVEIPAVLALGDSYLAGGPNFPDGSAGSEEHLWTQAGVPMQRLAVNGTGVVELMTDFDEYQNLIDTMHVSWGIGWTHFYNAQGTNDWQAGTGLSAFRTAMNTCNTLFKTRWSIPKVIVKTQAPSVSTTDGGVTLAGQSINTIGSSLIYNNGGAVMQYNASLIANDGLVPYDFCVKIFDQGRDPSAPEKFHVGLYPNTITGTITGVTNANPCVITSVNHGMTSTGGPFYVDISGVGGTTELNGNRYRITFVDADHFSLRTTADTTSNINSTGFGVYTSGGTWSRAGSAASESDSASNKVHFSGTAHQKFVDTGFDFTLTV